MMIIVLFTYITTVAVQYYTSDLSVCINPELYYDINMLLFLVLLWHYGIIMAYPGAAEECAYINI